MKNKKKIEPERFHISQLPHEQARPFLELLVCVQAQDTLMTDFDPSLDLANREDHVREITLDDARILSSDRSLSTKDRNTMIRLTALAVAVYFVRQRRSANRYNPSEAA